MTESDAKQKWCPMVRIVSVDLEDKDSRNRVSGAESIIPEDCLCIGSDCMAWRRDAMIEYHYAAPVPPGYQRIGHFIEPIEKSGYCGLAGKP
jgi:hypothetical protein